jgi:hypothetical protein
MNIEHERIKKSKAKRSNSRMWKIVMKNQENETTQRSDPERIFMMFHNLSV